jgi:hypothetical protein
MFKVVCKWCFEVCKIPNNLFELIFLVDDVYKWHFDAFSHFVSVYKLWEVVLLVIM